MIRCNGKARTGRAKRGSYRQGRNKKLCIRLSEFDLAKLNRLCDYYGMTKADIIINAIDEACEGVSRRERRVRRTAASGH